MTNGNHACNTPAVDIAIDQALAIAVQDSVRALRQTAIVAQAAWAAAISRRLEHGDTIDESVIGAAQQHVDQAILHLTTVVQLAKSWSDRRAEQMPAEQPVMTPDLGAG